MRSLVSCISALFLCAACGQSAVIGELDSGTSDAGLDAGNDGGSDAGMDAGSDAGVDAGPVVIGGIAAGNHSTCGFTPSGDLSCWGRDDSGELGNLSTTNSLLPVRGTFSGAIAVATGTLSSCALKADHTAWCWGDVLSDQQMALPPAQLQISAPVEALYFSDFNAIALTQGASTDAGVGSLVAYAFGPNQGTAADAGSSFTIPEGTSAFAAGEDHVCYVLGGDVFCMGSNYAGQLGNGTLTDSSTPVQVTGLSDVVSIAAGQSHTCALTSPLSGSLIFCWGDDVSLELGTTSPGGSCAVEPSDNEPCSPTPLQVHGTPLHPIALSAFSTSGFTLALDQNGSVWAWGANSYGQLGTPACTPSDECGTAVPAQISGLPAIAQISAGDDYACACAIDGSAWCWGDSESGKLGTLALAARVNPPALVQGFRCDGAPPIQQAIPAQGSADVQGTYQGESFSVSEATGYSFAGRCGNSADLDTALAVILSSQAGECAAVTSNQVIPNNVLLGLVISYASSSAQPAAIAPGTYGVDHGGDPEVTAQIVGSNATCGGTSASETAEAGFVTILSVDGGALTGTFSFTFDGGTLTGAFSTADCPQGGAALCGGATTTCQ